MEIEKKDSTYCAKGDLLFEMKKYKEAIEFYDMAIGENSECLWAWNGIGIANMELGKIKKALNYFKSALEIDSEFEEAIKNKEIALSKLN